VAFPFDLSLADLHRSLDDSLLVRHIAVPLETCKISDDAKAVQRSMEQQNFDVQGATENGVIRGFVRRQDLNTGKCQGALKPFSPADIIASTTPLVDLLPVLRVRPYLFILDRTKLTSLVTRSDLQKSPVRMLLFGLVSLLEMYLLTMVRMCYSGDSFSGRLSPAREAKAKALFANRTQADEEIDLVDCLKLADKYHLLLKVPGFADFFKLGEAREATKKFKKMEALRDKLAHGQDLTTGPRWEDVLAVASDLDAFLGEFDARRAEFDQRFAATPKS
jgi:hypothetical protein